MYHPNAVRRLTDLTAERPPAERMEKLRAEIVDLKERYGHSMMGRMLVRFREDSITKIEQEEEAAKQRRQATLQRHNLLPA
jgi:hypothetical protein